MWSGSGSAWSQSQWPMQQAMYQNIPHEEVDWAALAQQWIQMRENMTGTGDHPPPPIAMTGDPTALPTVRQSLSQSTPRPILPGNGIGSSRVPPKFDITPTTRPILETRDALNHSDNSNSQDESTYSQGGDWSNYLQSGWNALGSMNWARPPSDTKEAIQTFEYGHMHGNQGYAATQTYDYNHGSEQLGFNQTMPGQAPYNQYWSQGGPPPFLRKDKKEDIFDIELSPAQQEENATQSLDAAKRKNLPAWIREGLEKMERDKQKKIEREQMLREREQRLKIQQEEEERAMRELQELESKPSLPRKSKFDSESDGEGSLSPVSRKRSPTLRTNHHEASPVHPRTPSPIETPKTEQEKLEIMMLKVRQLLTEILLEVTSEEINSIAKDTFIHAQNKAPALQLAKSSALASITGSLGGLGGYGSDSDITDSDDSSEESDAKLKENIQKRKLEFARRAKELGGGFQSDISDDEQDIYNEKKKHEAKDEKKDIILSKAQTPAFLSPRGEDGREKYHFEKKYAGIPGLEINPDSNEMSADDTENLKPWKGEGMVVVKKGNTDSDDSSSSSSTSTSSSSSNDSSSNSSTSSSKSKHSHSNSSSKHDKRSSSKEHSKSPIQSKETRRNRQCETRLRSSSREKNDKYARHGKERSSSGDRDRRKSRSRSRDRGRRTSRRSRSRSSSRSRSRDRKGSARRSSRSDRDSGRPRRYPSRSRSRSYSKVRRSHSRSPSNRHSQHRSRSRSRSPRRRSRSRQRYRSRYSRSRSRDSYDRAGKKSRRRP